MCKEEQERRRREEGELEEVKVVKGLLGLEGAGLNEGAAGLEGLGLKGLKLMAVLKRFWKNWA